MDITINVLGEFDVVKTRVLVTTTSAAVIKRQLRQAIASLEAELAAVDEVASVRQALVAAVDGRS